MTLYNRIFDFFCKALDALRTRVPVDEVPVLPLALLAAVLHQLAGAAGLQHLGWVLRLLPSKHDAVDALV